MIERRTLAQIPRVNCPFCDYSGPSPILRDAGDVFVIRPINPVVPEHVLVVPRKHVTDFAASPLLTARCAAVAARLVGDQDCNLITSKGAAATQTVEHLHFHLVPREPGDGLALPWT